VARAAVGPTACATKTNTASASAGEV